MHLRLFGDPVLDLDGPCQLPDPWREPTRVRHAVPALVDFPAPLLRRRRDRVVLAVDHSGRIVGQPRPARTCSMNARSGGMAPMIGRPMSRGAPSQAWLDWKNGLRARLSTA